MGGPGSGRAIEWDRDKVGRYLVMHHGNLSKVAHELGCSRAAVAMKVRADDELQTIAVQAREAMVDDAEETLYDLAIKKKNVKALIFILKTMGRRRGYGQVNVNLNVDVTKLSDNELEQLLSG